MRIGSGIGISSENDVLENPPGRLFRKNTLAGAPDDYIDNVYSYPWMISLGGAMPPLTLLACPTGDDSNGAGWAPRLVDDSMLI
jgi:hypothetical protein